MNDKIGWGQLGIVLTLSRIFSEAANFPSDDINYGMQRFTVIVLSYLLLIVVLIPVFLLVRREGAVFSLSDKWAAGIVILYLILAAVSTCTRLQFYASSTIFDAAPPWLIIISVAAVCLYGIFKGLPAVLRTGVIVGAGFLVLLLTVIIGISDDITLSYLYPALIDDPYSLTADVLSEFSKNAEGVLFAVLCLQVRQKAIKSLFISIPLSLFAMLLMTFLYNTVLGEYLDVTNFPFYALSSLSDISVLQRLDGIDVVMWIMSAVIKVSLLMLSVFTITFTSFGNRRGAFITACTSLAVTTAASLYFSVNTNDFLVFSGIMETGIPFFTAVFLVPAAILTMRTIKLRREKKFG